MNLDMTTTRKYPNDPKIQKADHCPEDNPSLLANKPKNTFTQVDIVNTLKPRNQASLKEAIIGQTNDPKH